MRLLALCSLALLAACHSAPPVVAPAPSLVIVQPEPETHAAMRIEKREKMIRDHELLEAAKASLDRAIKRLDWLNGRDPGT